VVDKNTGEKVPSKSGKIFLQYLENHLGLEVWFKKEVEHLL
jgi:hypothetical protein